MLYSYLSILYRTTINILLVCERVGSVIEVGQCVPCPANSYAGAGNTTCTACPTNSSTTGVTGATSIDACGEEWSEYTIY